MVVTVVAAVSVSTLEGPTAARANSYDDGWQSEWVAHASSLLSTANALIRTDVVGTAVVGTVGWTQRSATFTSPANAASVVFVLQTLNEPDNVGTAWFDDLQLATP